MRSERKGAGVVVYETERLVVRPWTHDEAELDRLYDIYSRWEVSGWLGANPKVLESRDLAPAIVDRWLERSQPDRGFGVWAVQVRDTGIVAGTVLLVPLPDGDGEIEVGWHFHPDSWGHGYATEAARSAIEHGFANGLTEVYAVVRPDNARSLAVCHRLGMTPLGPTQRWYGVPLEAFRFERRWT